MGLITKEVDVKLCGAVIGYYKSKGYNISEYKDKWGKFHVKSGTIITVKVEDLPKSSHVIIECECDICKKVSKMKYDNYNKQNHNGKTYCNQCCYQITHIGENNGKWNPNLTEEDRHKTRSFNEYYEFIKSVMARDKGKCQICGKEHQNNVVHHLDGYEWCVEKRTDVSNGICLCEKCHKDFHYRYGNKGNTKEQFEEYIGKRIKLNNYECQESQIFICLENEKIIKNPSVYAKENGFSNTLFYGKRYLVNGKHYITYEKYLELKKDNKIEDYLFWSTTKSLCNGEDYAVICLNYNKVFYSKNLASEYFSISKNGILDCCKNKRHTSGIYQEEQLKWMFVKDYMIKNNISSISKLKETCNIIPIEECKNKLL